jgi:cytochrome c
VIVAFSGEAMKSPISMIAAAAFGLAFASTPQAQEPLAKASGCLACHNVEGAKKMGPSFKDTAAKYKGKADAEAALVAKVSEGKGHPKVKSSAEDTKALVKWILSM